MTPYDQGMEMVERRVREPFFCPVIIFLLVLILAGYLAGLLAGEFAMNQLALSPGSCIPMKPWQLITYPFINFCPLVLLFNSVILLWVGRTVARQWGARSFLMFWVLISVSCGLIWIIVNLVLGRESLGAGWLGCYYALMTVYGLTYRRREIHTLLGVIQGGHLAMICIGVTALLTLPYYIGLLWLCGIPLGYVYYRLRGYYGKQARSYSSGRGGTGGNDGFVDVD